VSAAAPGRVTRRWRAVVPGRRDRKDHASAAVMASDPHLGWGTVVIRYLRSEERADGDAADYSRWSRQPRSRPLSPQSATPGLSRLDLHARDAVPGSVSAGSWFWSIRFARSSPPPVYESLSAGQRSRARITRSTFPSCSESRSKSRRTPSGIGVSFSDSQPASVSRAAPNSDASIDSSAERAWSDVNRPPNRMMRPRSRPVRSACVAKSKTRQSCAPD
jgi:hypothetical protein